MAVTIGHASIDENGKAKGGSSGDQSKKEVCIRNWYLHSKGWVVLRCKDAGKREKIAEAMEKACKNDQIGYDQNQRDSLFNNVKSYGFDPSKTTKQVETDCSALVRVCIAYAYGSDKAGNIRTISEPSTLVNTGLFTKYTSDKYCKSSDYLMRGDILCTPVSGHTVVVLSDGAKAKSGTSDTSNNSAATSTSSKKATDAAKNYLKSLAGTYKVTASWLNVRNGAGVTKKTMVTIPKGTKVTCYGYYTVASGTNWLYVQFTYNGVTYTGFASSKYLAK
jgi:uncharacterized protein YgiM (DUF1202 family)